MRRRPSLLWRILLGVLFLALLFPTTSPLISFGDTHTAPQSAPTELPGNPMTFEDVADSDYYYDAVRWAVEHGITEGTSNTTFAPGRQNRRSLRDLPIRRSLPMRPVPGHRS